MTHFWRREHRTIQRMFEKKIFVLYPFRKLWGPKRMPMDSSEILRLEHDTRMKRLCAESWYLKTRRTLFRKAVWLCTPTVKQFCITEIYVWFNSDMCPIVFGERIIYLLDHSLNIHETWHLRNLKEIVRQNEFDKDSSKLAHIYKLICYLAALVQLEKDSPFDQLSYLKLKLTL